MSDKQDLISAVTAPVDAASDPNPNRPADVKPPETPAPIVVDENDLLGGTGEPLPNNPAEPPPSIPIPPVNGDSGEPKRRGRGRPPGSKNRMTPNFDDIPPAAVVEVDYKQMSCALFDMSTGILTNAFGPEWQPRPPEQVGGLDERGAVCTALEVYLKSKQAKDIPPGLMLTIVVVAYAAPRLQAPTTKEKLLPMANWCWMKIKSFFGRKKSFEPQVISPIKN